MQAPVWDVDALAFALSYSGQPIPDVTYSEAEIETW